MPSELVWECQEAGSCECGAVGSAYYSSKNNILAAFQEFLLSDEKSEAMVRRMWREIHNIPDAWEEVLILKSTRNPNNEN